MVGFCFLFLKGGRGNMNDIDAKILKIQLFTDAVCKAAEQHNLTYQEMISALKGIEMEFSDEVGLGRRMPNELVKIFKKG